MPSRNYCDRCDNRILDGYPIYSVRTNVVEQGSSSRNDFKIKDAWTGPVVDQPMWCRNCMKDILTLIYTKPDVGA